LEKIKAHHSKQLPKAFWLTGRPSAGKTTLGNLLQKELLDLGHRVIVLDGDSLRTGLNKDLGFSEEDREENIRRVAEVAKLLIANGITVICCLVSPLQYMRDKAKSIIGSSDFNEIYIDASVEICTQRDVKGLYAKAAEGVVKNLTGIGAKYEAPANPDLHINTGETSIPESLMIIKNFVLNRISFN
jgi:adenylylsulfate kinase